MRATFGDFSADPALLGNASVRYLRCRPAEGHLAVEAGGGVEMDFPLEEDPLPEQVTLTVTALVVPSPGSLGYAPVDVVVNGRTLTADFTVPGGSLPRDTAFAVPGDLLVPGTNTLRLSVSDTARGVLWLHRITLNPSHALGAARRAMTEGAACESVLAYSTARRPAGDDRASWEPAPQLLVHLDRGERSLPVQLSWRGRDGVEAAVCFLAETTEFYGCHRAADGSLTDYRGRLVRRWALPEGAAAATAEGAADGFPRGAYEDAVHRFRTEEEGSDGCWHTSGGLRLLVEDGGVPVERVTWCDEAGNFGAVALRAAASELAGEEEVTHLVGRVEASREEPEAGEVAQNLVEEGGTRWMGVFEPHAWLEFTLDRPVVVRHYVLTSANDDQEQDLRDWSLEGSHDGRHWVTLDTRTGESFPERHLSRGFRVNRDIEDPTAYQYYRLDITRNAGAIHVQLERVRLFASAPAPAGFSGWYQRSGQGPIGYRGTAETVARAETVTRAEALASGPRTVEQWCHYLGEYGAEMLRLADEDQLDQISDEQRAAAWLGVEGADEDRLRALEERLGTRLPPSFRSFLGASDGWLTLGAHHADWRMRTTDTIGWLREEEPWLWEIVGEYRGARLADHALLISVVEDQDDWLLDSSHVSEDGEWPAYRSVAFSDERFASFAELVAAERKELEEVAGAEGHPLHPEGAEELVAKGRAQTLRGEVISAMKTFEYAITKGSGAGAYLRVMLEAFLEVTDYEYGKKFYYEKVFSGVFGHPHVMEAVGREQVRAEAAALILRGQSDFVPDWDEHNYGPFPRRLLVDVLPEVDDGTDESDADWAARVDTFVPSPLPEPPAFRWALEVARSLARGGDTDHAWDVVEAALPQWRSDSPYRIAPVVLLTDPVLRRLITPTRARQIVTTPRQDGLK